MKVLLKPRIKRSMDDAEHYNGLKNVTDTAKQSVTFFNPL